MKVGVPRWVALASALALASAGCGGDDAPDERLAYTVVPSAEAPPAGAGTRSSVETDVQMCLSGDGSSVEVPVPSSWSGDGRANDECSWASDGGTITLTYGEIADNDADVWQSLLAQHNAAQLEHAIPGYAFIRYTANEGGGPLWHYRYIDAEVEGGVYVDSLNLYRDGWQITYEAESTAYNSYLADQLIQHADVV